MTNCKVESKLRWTRYSVLPVADNESNINEDTNANNTNFTMKDTKLYVHLVTLSTRDNQQLSTLLNKGFERSVYWNEYKTKSENKNTKNEFRYFLESNVVGVNRLFLLVYPNRNNNSKILFSG